MKQPIWQSRIATVLFSLTVAAFFAFFLYMGTAEQVSVFQAEQAHDYGILTDAQMEILQDDTAPAGIRKVYRWTPDSGVSQGSCLCFNIAHHHIQVYAGDTLVYSLTGSEHNRIGQNVSSNWCSVPLLPAYTGQTITVVLTPLFDAAIGKDVQFLVGSHYSIAMDLLRSEIPLLILSALCILLGVAVFAVSVYFRCILQAEISGLVYLGLFSIVLGLWKITDLRYFCRNSPWRWAIPFHGLRHTSATLLIAGHQDVRSVSARLGHAQTSTTMNIYAHALAAADQTAADTLEKMLVKHA